MARNNSYRQKTGSGPHAGLVARTLAALVWSFLVLAFLLLISLALVAGYRWITTTPVLALHQVQVQGLQRLSRSEVVNQAELDRFHNLVDLSLWRVRQSLIQHPWIDSVSLQRHFPHTLRIQVEEKVPFFWRQQGERIFYADEHGELIAPVSTETFTSLPLLVCDPSQRRDQRDLSIVNKGWSQNDFPFGLQDVAWIRFQNNNQVQITLLDHSLKVILGRESLEENIRIFAPIWHDLKQRDELEHVERILILKGSAWVGYRSNIV
ncbi:MAG: cell division protein FtsQ/DivIB [Desulfovermiculus sp.]